MRTVSVDYKGKRYRFPIGSQNAEEAVKELQTQLCWTERLLVYCCYLNCEMASRAMSECVEVFLKRPDKYRQTTKKLTHGARVDLLNTIRVILLNSDKAFLENYSGNFCEEVQGMMDYLRNCIWQELRDAGVKEAQLYAYVNTAYVMLEYCVKSYDRLMNELKEKFGRDFYPLYIDFRPSKAFRKWSDMFTALFEKDSQECDLDLSDNEKCRNAFLLLDNKLLDYNTIINNIVKAYEELPEDKKTAEQDKIIANYVKKTQSA